MSKKDKDKYRDRGLETQRKSKRRNQRKRSLDELRDIINENLSDQDIYDIEEELEGEWQ